MSSKPKKKVVKSGKKRSTKKKTSTTPLGDDAGLVMPERKSRKKKEKRKKELQMLGLEEPDSPMEEKKSTAAAHDDGGVDDYDDYGDDFEDYDDDDFEDDTPAAAEAKHEQPVKAPQARKHDPPVREERRKRESKDHDDDPEELPVRLPPKTNSLDDDPEANASVLGYPDAGAYERARDKQRRRARNLQARVPLEIEKADLFEMHSLQPWEFYVQSVGSLGLVKQASSQTGEDAREIGVQAEPIEQNSMSTNFPEAASAADGDQELDDGEQAAATTYLPHLDEMTMLMETLIEERASNDPEVFGEGDQETKYGETDLFSQQVDLPTNVGEAFEFAFSRKRPSLLLTAHLKERSSAESGERENNEGTHEASVIGRNNSECELQIWDLANVGESVPKEPGVRFTAPSSITKILLWSGRSDVVIAGTSEGSIVLWSVAKREYTQKKKKSKKSRRTMRKSNWSTDNIIDQDKVHFTSIVDMKLFGDQDGTTQLASVDLDGVVHIWTLGEFHSASPEEEDTEIVKLVHVAKSKTDVGDTNSLSIYGTEAMCVSCPVDGGQVFVGTSTGAVVRHDRYDSKEFPKVYENPSMSFDTSRAVTSIDFNPAVPMLFLVGYSDCTISLFHMQASVPLKTWNEALENESYTSTALQVMKLEWSRDRPSVFYVLDSAGKVYAWDLLKDDQTAVVRSMVASAEETSYMNFAVTGGNRVGQRAWVVMNVRGQVAVMAPSSPFVNPILKETNKLLKKLKLK